MSWKENFEEDKEIVLATASIEGKPNANIVISLGFIDNKLLIADCLMNVTINNLKENPNICLIGGYFRLRGKAEIYGSGEPFNICRGKNKGYLAKNAILITVEEVFDLDKGEKIL